FGDGRQCMALQLLLQISDQFYMYDNPGINTGSLPNLFYRYPDAERLVNVDQLIPVCLRQTTSSRFLICWNRIPTRKHKVFVLPELLQYFAKIMTYIHCFFLCRRSLCSVIFTFCTSCPVIYRRPQQNAGLFLVVMRPCE